MGLLGDTYDTIAGAADDAAGPLDETVGGATSEAGEVVDPTQAAGDTTEAWLRINPVTAGPAFLSDAADFGTGETSSPNPLTGGGIALFRQFDDNPGGGLFDSDTWGDQFGSGTDGDGGGGGVGIPWTRLAFVGALFVGFIVAVNAFAGGLAEGVTDG